MSLEITMMEQFTTEYIRGSYPTLYSLFFLMDGTIHEQLTHIHLKYIAHPQLLNKAISIAHSRIHHKVMKKLGYTL